MIWGGDKGNQSLSLP